MKSLSITHTKNGNSRQYWSELINWITSSATAVANSTTETILVPNFVIPAGYLNDGRVLRITVMGSYGTTATPTLTARLRWGGVSGTVLAASGAITTPSGAGGGASMTALFNIRLLVQVRSNGSAGTVMTGGEIELFTTGTASGVEYPIASGSTGGTTPVAVTADLSADTALAISVQWGTANAANSIVATHYTIEALN